MTCFKTTSGVTKVIKSHVRNNNNITENRLQEEEEEELHGPWSRYSYLCGTDQGEHEEPACNERAPPKNFAVLSSDTVAAKTQNEGPSLQNRRSKSTKLFI